MDGKLKNHTWLLKFPYVTWKIADHIWLFYGFQKS